MARLPVPMPHHNDSSANFEACVDDAAHGKTRIGETLRPSQLVDTPKVGCPAGNPGNALELVA
ncbi:MAG: hypothetical protein ABIO45_14570 [Burkholderiaceae bacterium]